MKSKHGLMFAAMAGLFMGGMHDFPSDSGPFKVREKVSTKPVFTEEELAAVRACATKRERKAMVNELRRKYAKKDT
jgi:hypothetical protein